MNYVYVFGDQGPLLEYSCQRWFPEGREDIEDQAPPVTERTTEHIEEVRCVILI